MLFWQGVLQYVQSEKNMQNKKGNLSVAFWILFD